MKRYAKLAADEGLSKLRDRDLEPQAQGQVMPRGLVLVEPDREMTWSLTEFAADGVLLISRNCIL